MILSWKQERKVARGKERHDGERERGREGAKISYFCPLFREIYSGFKIFNLLDKLLAGLSSCLLPIVFGHSIIKGKVCHHVLAFAN